VGYEDPDGQQVSEPPLDWRELESLTPLYEELEGWSEDITACTDFVDLPAAAQAYIEYIEQAVGVHAGIVSVGPGRKQTFER
jgi:adenylosuccinate synthase